MDLFKWAVNQVKNFLGGGSKPAPKAAPAPKAKPAPYIKPLPKITFKIAPRMNMGATWTSQANASNARQVAASRAVGDANAARLRADAIARQALMERLRRQAVERERRRRETQAALDKVHATLRADRQNQAKGALDWLLKKGGNPSDWRTYFDDSGNFKGASIRTGNNFQIPSDWYNLDPRYKKAYGEWSAWYNSAAGLEQKTKDEYRKRAQRIIDQAKQQPKGGFLSQVIDKLTFGGTRRAMGAREQAAKLYQETMTGQKKRYEDAVKSYYAERAKRRQTIESKKFASWTEYNAAVKQYNEWDNSKVKQLQYAAAATQGTLEGFDSKSKEKITNVPGTIGNWLNDNIVHGPIGDITGNIWKFTLGSGDKNVPSLVTAPSRAYNTFLNAINHPKMINDKEGNSHKATGNPWIDSFNQSNFNATYGAQSYKDFARNRYLSMKNPKPVVPLEFSPGWKPGQKPQVKFDQKEFEKWEANNHAALDKAWKDSEARGKSTYLMANDIALDPLSYLGGAKLLGKASGAGKWLERASKVATDTKPFRKAGNFLKGVKSSQLFTKLTAEAKTPRQSYLDAVTAANKATDQAQADLLPKLRSHAAVLAKERGILKGKFDDSVLDDFRKMAEAGDNEAAKFLQEMRNGEFSTAAKIKNWTRAGGIGSNPRLLHLKDLADRWSKFSEQQRKADEVWSTRFGAGKKRSFYSPRTKYIDLEKYDFRKFKKNLAPQSAEDLYRGAVDRYFKSNVIDYWGDAQKAKVNKLDLGLQSLLDQYEARTAPAAAEVERTFRKTRTPYGRANGFLSKYGPNSLWKKSVLKYRPAWYVNNFLYNTQAAALAGGGRAVAEQFRLFRPRNYRAALADLPSDVRTTVANEIGNGRVARFGNAVENVSRMGAYRALRAQGLDHAAALKRVNRYLLDYSTKNYERPLRAVMPFYSFQKGIAKAAFTMPFDRPGAAIAYNRLDRYQKQQFDADFDKIVPKLKSLGYSDAEIEAMRKEQGKYYEGKLKVGDKYINTPFNAFSEKGGFDGGGISPWVSALAEAASAKDKWGSDLVGADANIGMRLLSKFPQADLARKGFEKYLISSGKKKPSQSWIAAAGSDGFGLTKEAQGYDPTKSNYQQKLDTGAKFTQDLKAFLGMPRTTTFDAAKFFDIKKLQKVKDEYFSIDWKNMPFAQQEQKRAALFKKYGMTADQFYDGDLAKYDTATTKRIKAMKQDAFNKTRALFDEYGRQPKGTRNVWATRKLKQLVDQGYFATNPFLKSFDWTDPGTIAKAYRKMDYDFAKATGDWSKYQGKYGKPQKMLDYQYARRTGDWSKWEAKYGRSAKALARDYAVKTGDWSKYIAKYGVTKKETPYKYKGKFFKSAATMARYKEGEFWQRYIAADKLERRQLLKENPQYDRRSNWTDQMWDEWKIKSKADQRKKAMASPKFAYLMEQNLLKNNRLAAPVLRKKALGKKTKLVFASR